MKNTSQIAAFKLSVLSTWLLCITANSFASDIEIYKAPTAADGKARIMLNLDNSALMAGTTGGFSGGSTSIKEDYGNDVVCKDANDPDSKTYFTQSVSRTYNNRTYIDDEYYCTVKASELNKSNVKLNKLAIAGTNGTNGSCEATGTGPNYIYKCFDRFTLARRSLYNVVNDPDLGDKVSIGISVYPLFNSTNIQSPLPLTLENRDLLNQKIHEIPAPVTDVSATKQVPVAKGYGVAAKTLLTDENGGALTADQCSGYGIFSLTAGLPLHDDLVNAQTNIDSVLQRDFQGKLATDCPGNANVNDGSSWRCVGKAADLLAASKSKIAMPVKSLVVSFGSSFTFTPPLPPYDAKMTTAQMIQQVINTIPLDINGNGADVNNNKRDAAISGVKGGGGYYTVNDTNALTETIKKFIADVAKADIPYLTTGAPTIPQDPLNPALVQSDAYYSQFKPTPTTNPAVGNSLWAGNMKKYHVDNLGRLLGKGDNAVLDDLGRLEIGTHDFWAPPVSADETIRVGDETIWGSELYARMGG